VPNGGSSRRLWPLRTTARQAADPRVTTAGAAAKATVTAEAAWLRRLAASFFPARPRPKAHQPYGGAFRPPDSTSKIPPFCRGQRLDGDCPISGHFVGDGLP